MVENADFLDACGCIKDPHGDRHTARQTCLCVRYSLVLDPYDIRLLRHGNVEGELAFGVRFCLGHVLHAFADFFERDLISGGRLVGGAVLDDTFQRVSRGSKRADQEDESNGNLLQWNGLLQAFADSSISISAMMRAASASRPRRMPS